MGKISVEILFFIEIKIKPGSSFGLLPLHQLDILPIKLFGSRSFFFFASISASRRIHVKLNTSNFFSNSYWLSANQFSFLSLVIKFLPLHVVSVLQLIFLLMIADEFHDILDDDSNVL